MHLPTKANLSSLPLIFKKAEDTAPKGLAADSGIDWACTNQYGPLTPGVLKGPPVNSSGAEGEASTEAHDQDGALHFSGRLLPAALLV